MAFDLCTGKKAGKPFLIRSIQVRVWTIEELCFFLYHNLYLIDDSVVNTHLADWISEELGLKSLGNRLGKALKKPDEDISDFILPIFAEIGYLAPDQMREVKRKLAMVQVQPEEERRKQKADYLLSAGKYADAQAQYRALLQSGEKGRIRTSFLESVWNNLGCAYAMQFRFQEAGDCFLSGWQLGHSRELLRKYISVLPLFLPEEEYERRLGETGADRIWAGEVRKMNAKLARETEERILARTYEEEDVRKEAESLFSAYRRSVL